jgi:hypothetical protein
MSDLVVSRGQEQTFSGDVAVCGWVEVSGTLVCESDLVCLGVSIEPGGSLRCKRLVANVVELDNLSDNSRIEADFVRARVVSIVQVMRGVLSDTERLTADYVHHYAGDLNPCCDYERGDRGVLGPRFITGDELPLELHMRELRSALSAGRNPFVGVGLLVETGNARSKAPVGVPEDPLVGELITWLAQHPGPQRKLFEDLQASWTQRLLSCADRSAAARAITKATKSPKVAAARDAWLARIGIGLEARAMATPATGPNERHDALIVHLDPPRDPGAWLDQFPLDATEIDITESSIVEIPPRIERYCEVRLVQLAYNHIKRLPDELCRLVKLESLDVRGNRLAELPDSLGKLLHLTTLHLEENDRLTRLPASLCDLASLTYLNLGNMPVTHLPDDFGQLAALRDLVLQGCNLLVTLPESFFSLPRLESLNLHGTRLRGSDLARVRTTFPNANFGRFFTDAS